MTRRWAGYDLYITRYKLSHLTSTPGSVLSTCLKTSHFIPSWSRIRKFNSKPSPGAVYLPLGSLEFYHHTVFDLFIKRDKLVLCTETSDFILFFKVFFVFLHTALTECINQTPVWVVYCFPCFCQISRIPRFVKSVMYLGHIGVFNDSSAAYNLSILGRQTGQ